MNPPKTLELVNPINGTIALKVAHNTSLDTRIALATAIENAGFKTRTQNRHDVFPAPSTIYLEKFKNGQVHELIIGGVKSADDIQKLQRAIMALYKTVEVEQTSLLNELEQQDPFGVVHDVAGPSSDLSILASFGAATRTATIAQS